MNKNQKAIRRIARATINNEGTNEMAIGNRTIAIRRRPPLKHNACKVAGRTARANGERALADMEHRLGRHPFR